IVAVVSCEKSEAKSKWPQHAGPLIKIRGLRSSPGAAPYRLRGERPVLQAETGLIAVTIRDQRARHQEAVDRGHQAGEQGARGGEGDGGGLGHRSLPSSETVSIAVSIPEGS